MPFARVLKGNKGTLPNQKKKNSIFWQIFLLFDIKN